MVIGRFPLLGLTVATLIASACASSAPGATSQGAAAPEKPAAPKVLTVAVQRVPVQLFNGLGQPETSVGGASHIFSLPHDKLVATDSQGALVPRLVSEIISTDKGTWLLNADGSMDTTWKIRTNVKWQDGEPFTSNDLLFTFNVFKDKEIPNTGGAALGLMVSATAPDPLTFTIHWRAPYITANTAPILNPLPKHLFNDLYSNDKPNFLNSPYTTSQFIGLGPYKLSAWDPGLEVRFSRFDDYYLGHPALDTIVVKVIPDANALIANILADAVDVILSEGADLDAEIEMKSRWEGTGNQVLVVPASPGGGLRHFEIQFRPEYAQPKEHGLAEKAVRQAFFQSINRQELTEVITHGYGPPADSWVPPYHALRPQLESAITQYPYDVTKAQQLLAQAGWVKGTDGVLVHQQTGEKFQTLLYSSQGSNVEKAVNVVAPQWKAMGAMVDTSVIPIALGSDRQYRATLPGAGYTGGVGYDAFSTDRLHSKFIAAPSNNWTGSNRGGYGNAEVDVLIDRIVITIDNKEQISLQRQMLQTQGADLAVMPLLWDISAFPVLKGVKGIELGDAGVAQWDKRV